MCPFSHAPLWGWVVEAVCVLLYLCTHIVVVFLKKGTIRFTAGVILQLAFFLLNKTTRVVSLSVRTKLPGLAAGYPRI